jgi:hypothetical protein
MKLVSMCEWVEYNFNNEQDTRWYLSVLPTTLPRLALRAQARRKEKGCPYYIPQSNQV